MTSSVNTESETHAQQPVRTFDFNRTRPNTQADCPIWSGKASDNAHRSANKTLRALEACEKF
jgi:hypothetical protein